MEAHEGAAFNEDNIFAEMGYEEAQKLKFFSPSIEILIIMMVSERMKHGHSMFTLVRRGGKPKCKMKLHGAVWFQEDLYFRKVKMKIVFFFLTFVYL